MTAVGAPEGFHASQCSFSPVTLTNSLTTGSIPNTRRDGRAEESCARSTEIWPRDDDSEDDDRNEEMFSLPPSYDHGAWSCVVVRAYDRKAARSAPSLGELCGEGGRRETGGASA